MEVLRGLSIRYRPIATAGGGRKCVRGRRSSGGVSVDLHVVWVELLRLLGVRIRRKYVGRGSSRATVSVHVGMWKRRGLIPGRHGFPSWEVGHHDEGYF